MPVGKTRSVEFGLFVCRQVMINGRGWQPGTSGTKSWKEKESAAGSYILFFLNLTKTIWRLVSIFH
jgi:hypothetical protein